MSRYEKLWLYFGDGSHNLSDSSHPYDAFEKRDQEQNISFVSDLCALCDIVSDDVSSNYTGYGFFVDFLGGFFDSHGFSISSGEFACGVFRMLRIRVFAAAALIRKKRR